MYRYVRSSDWDTELRLLDAGILAYPSNAKLFANLAIAAYAVRGDLRRSVQAADWAIKLKPDTHTAYSMRGLVFKDTMAYDQVGWDGAIRTHMHTRNVRTHQPTHTHTHTHTTYTHTTHTHARYTQHTHVHTHAHRPSTTCAKPSSSRHWPTPPRAPTWACCSLRSRS
jgi:hypothetical protein